MALNSNSIYETQRRRAAQEAEAQSQSQQDALKRRFAAQGGLNSGAYIKQTQIAADDAMKRKQAALENIDMSEAQDLQRQKEVQEGRDFTRSEREAGQGFSAGQAELQRKYGTSEREAGQGFTAGQADLQRKFVSGEREAAQTYGTSERVAGQEFQTGERTSAQDFQVQRDKEQRDFEQRMEKIKQDYQTLEAEKQRHFQAGENDKAREIEKLQLELATQAQAVTEEAQKADLKYSEYEFSQQQESDKQGALAGFWDWLTGE